MSSTGTNAAGGSAFDLVGGLVLQYFRTKYGQAGSVCDQHVAAFVINLVAYLGDHPPAMTHVAAPPPAANYGSAALRLSRVGRMLFVCVATGLFPFVCAMQPIFVNGTAASNGTVEVDRPCLPLWLAGTPLGRWLSRQTGMGLSGSSDAPAGARDFLQYSMVSIDRTESHMTPSLDGTATRHRATEDHHFSYQHPTTTEWGAVATTKYWHNAYYHFQFIYNGFKALVPKQVLRDWEHVGPVYLTRDGLKTALVSLYGKRLDPRRLDQVAAWCDGCLDHLCDPSADDKMVQPPSFAVPPPALTLEVAPVPRRRSSAMNSAAAVAMTPSSVATSASSLSHFSPDTLLCCLAMGLATVILPAVSVPLTVMASGPDGGGATASAATAAGVVVVTSVDDPLLWRGRTITSVAEP